MFNGYGVNIFDSHETNTEFYKEVKGLGVYKSTVWIPKNIFSEGVILVGVALVTHDPFEVHFHQRDVLAFNMVDDLTNSPGRGDYVGEMNGVIRPLLEWRTKNFKDDKNKKLK